VPELPLGRFATAMLSIVMIEPFRLYFRARSPILGLVLEIEVLLA
jgi:hypothetical protein